MARQIAALTQIALGVVAAAALLIYGVLAAGGNAMFLLFAVLFLVFIGFDIALHVRAILSQARPEHGRVR